ncbi:glutamine amidotransferase [Actinomyces sp. F1_1611]
MARVLLAGESWINSATDHKGFDPFPHTQLQIGCTELLAALSERGHQVTHLRSHDVAELFPQEQAELDRFEVVILSDIGANSLLLSPRVFAEGKTAPNRLHLLRDWVQAGGSLLMAGGYLSFQGFQAKANYAGTAIEEVLPVNLFRWDDRVETPEGSRGEVQDSAHPIVAGLDRVWPPLLGYQQLRAKPEAEVLVRIGEDPLLTVWEYGQGRAAAYASDISPHWASAEFMAWAGYGQLFGALINWLARTDPSEV